MSVLVRYASRLQVVLGLALIGLVFAPSASSAAQLDTVTVSGSTNPGGISINAQSGTSGQNPSGTASYTAYIGGSSVPVSGQVTCLNVTGPDQGAGTPGSPTTAYLNFVDPTYQHAGLGDVIRVKVVDNGGNGADLFTDILFLSSGATDCSPSNFFVDVFPLNGRATVFDAPLLPTTKAQCKHGGWRNFPQFKNQGQCVAFVVKQARQNCVAERAKIGLVAFRNKYGLGPYHLRALRRCVNRATG